MVISALSVHLPERLVSNDYFVDQLGEKLVGDIVKMTGVSTRYWVGDNEGTLDLCLQAARKLDPAQLREVDGLIFVTQTPDYLFPGNSYWAHNKLQLSENCYCLDINSGCSGYVLGLVQAQSLLRSGTCHKILLLAGDTISKLISADDRSTALIFGDAGSASIIEGSGTDNNSFFHAAQTHSSGTDKLLTQPEIFNQATQAPKLHMDGSAVFNFTLATVPKVLQTLLQKSAWQQESIARFYLHQANAFMVKHLSKKLGCSANAPINIAKYGNTSSASIPLLLYDDFHSQPRAPERIALLGFGVGFSCVGIALQQQQQLVIAGGLH